MNSKKTGGRKAGTPNRASADVKALAQDYGEEAIDKLVQVMRTAPNYQAQVAAAKELLDRGYGKARLIGDFGHFDLPQVSKEQRDAATAAFLRSNG